MTFIIGLRFLTDHLAGDRYFKTANPGHNLQRARVQFAPAGRHGAAFSPRWRTSSANWPKKGTADDPGYFLRKTGWQKASSPPEENTLARTYSSSPRKA